MKTIVVNLLGAAGSGKSTIAGEVFVKLKKLGIPSENIQEYAKSVVYEENYKRLNDQLFIYANQYHSMLVAKDSARVLVIDSPLMLSLFYNRHFAKNAVPEDLFEKLIMDGYSKFDNMNYFINRKHEYKQEGRYQTEEEAKKQEMQMREMLFNMNIDIKELDSSQPCADIIVKEVQERIKFLEGMQKLGKEIERKFLIKEFPDDMKNCKKSKILQAYVCGGEKELRVRSVDGVRFYLTEKSGKGVVREENEKEITKDEFILYYNLANGKKLQKTRYFYPMHNHMAEIDIYKGSKGHWGVVEVEFDSKEDALKFDIPSWFGKEVTDNPKYKNFNLATSN